MYYIEVRLSSLVTWNLIGLVDKFIGQVRLMNRNNLRLQFYIISSKNHFSVCDSVININWLKLSTLTFPASVAR